jgi:hypothetical protein
VFSGFISAIVLVYMLSFSFDYKTDGWDIAVDPVSILGNTAVAARGNAFVSVKQDLGSATQKDKLSNNFFY